MMRRWRSKPWGGVGEGGEVEGGVEAFGQGAVGLGGEADGGVGGVGGVERDVGEEVVLRPEEAVEGVERAGVGQTHKGAPVGTGGMELGEQFAREVERAVAVVVEADGGDVTHSRAWPCAGRSCGRWGCAVRVCGRRVPGWR